MYYSAKENEFCGQQKEGYVFIDDNSAFSLFAQKQNGGYIVPDNLGNPVVKFRDPPTSQQQRDAIQAQIVKIEDATHMNRAVREMMLILAEEKAAALGYTPAMLYLANPAYKSVKDIDTQIVALRTQMDAIV
jgi:hypothetical protein